MGRGEGRDGPSRNVPKFGSHLKFRCRTGPSHSGLVLLENSNPAGAVRGWALAVRLVPAIAVAPAAVCTRNSRRETRLKAVNGSSYGALADEQLVEQRWRKGQWPVKA